MERENRTHNLEEAPFYDLPEDAEKMVSRITNRMKVAVYPTMMGVAVAALGLQGRSDFYAAITALGFSAAALGGLSFVLFDRRRSKIEDQYKSEQLDLGLKNTKGELTNIQTVGK